MNTHNVSFYSFYIKRHTLWVLIQSASQRHLERVRTMYIFMENCPEQIIPELS